MPVLARVFILALLAPTLAGCLTSETLIRLNADRSGTLEQVILLNTKTFEMLPQMMGDMMGGDAKVKPSAAGGMGPLDLFDEATLRAEAPTLGEGVRFVSVEQLVRGDLQGARAIYAFDDVNTLVVERDPPTGALGGTAPKGRTRDVFDFEVAPQANGHTLLTVRFDEARAGKAMPGKTSGASKGEMPPGADAMIKQMFDGFRIAIDVEVNGAIVATSSPFVQGARVTVLEMDLGRLLNDPANLKALERIGPGASVGEMIPLLKDITGIKVNQSPLTIEFTGR